MTSKSKNIAIDIDIDKPDDNQPLSNSVPEVVLQEDAIVSETLESTTAVFATDFYKATGIAYCSLCGEKRRTNQSGLFCPTSHRECPLT